MIYSIGHGSKKIEEFIEELNCFQINYLIDVRSSPYSRFNPQFNRELLKHDLEKKGIIYVYLGETLGGLPNDRSCYIDGKVDYNIIKEKVFFKDGLDRLIIAHKKNINVAVMCSESKPEECHRSKLIGQELLKHHISMIHIISDKKIKEQVMVMNELNKGKNLINLFNDEINFTSRKKYQ